MYDVRSPRMSRSSHIPPLTRSCWWTWCRAKCKRTISRRSCSRRCARSARAPTTTCSSSRRSWKSEDSIPCSSVIAFTFSVPYLMKKKTEPLLNPFFVYLAVFLSVQTFFCQDHLDIFSSSQRNQKIREFMSFCMKLWQQNHKIPTK